MLSVEFGNNLTLANLYVLFHMILVCVRGIFCTARAWYQRAHVCYLFEQGTMLGRAYEHGSGRIRCKLRWTRPNYLPSSPYTGTIVVSQLSDHDLGCLPDVPSQHFICREMCGRLRCMVGQDVRIDEDPRRHGWRGSRP